MLNNFDGLLSFNEHIFIVRTVIGLKYTAYILCLIWPTCEQVVLIYMYMELRLRLDSLLFGNANHIFCT